MIKPLGIHVLLEPIEEQSLVVLPEGSKGQAEKAIVRGIGEGVGFPALEVGQVVLYRKYSPEEFEVDGRLVYLIESVDLMGIYEEHSQGDES